MGIGSQCDIYIAVAKELLNCFTRFAQSKKSSGIGMPKKIQTFGFLQTSLCFFQYQSLGQGREGRQCIAAVSDAIYGPFKFKKHLLLYSFRPRVFCHFYEPGKRTRRNTTGGAG